MPPRKTAVAPQLGDGYAPGPIRQSADIYQHAVSRFTERHPEYSKLAPDEVLQAMSTHRTDDEQEERRRLEDEGVPVDWARRGAEDEDMPNDTGRY